MTDATDWMVSADGKYRYVRFMHQPARSDIDMTSGTPFYGAGYENVPIAVRQELVRLTSLYRFARLVRVTYDVFPPASFLSVGQTVGAADPAFTGEYYARIDHKNFRFFACPLHEYPAGTKSDSSNANSLYPSNLLGLSSLPSFQPPDQIDYATNQSGGSEAFERLFEDRRIRILSGLRKRRFVWKPYTKFDKMYTSFDLDKINDAENALSSFDDDQRSGGLWMALDQSQYMGLGTTLNASESPYHIPLIVRVRFAFSVSGRT